jgi:hypothetical protein
VSNPAPWWVTYVFLFMLVGAAFSFVLTSKMTAEAFLAFAAALGFRVPPSQAPEETPSYDEAEE